MPSSTGGYPWSIEGDSSTFIHIKNVADKPCQYRLQLSYVRNEHLFERGVYSTGLTKVEPGQSITVDIRKLRDNRNPDSQGRLLPFDAVRGQVLWSIEGEERLAFIGRSEQADIKAGLSSSYACVNCCPDTVYNWWCDPSSVDGLPGGTTQFIGWQQNQNCYGTLLNPFQVVTSNWSSTNTNVAAITSNGFATAQNPGTTTLGANWTVHIWELTQFGCDHIFNTAFVSALCNVRDVPKIRSISQHIIDESQQGTEVVECGRFKVTIKYDVSCPPSEHALELVGNITQDAVFLCNEAHLLLENEDDEVCTYEIRKIYRMKNRLAQTVGTGFTSYKAQITDRGRTVTKNGPGVSVRATIPGVGACPGILPCP